MKQIIVVAAGVLALGASNAFAEGCAYGKHQSAMADASEVQDTADVDGLSPELLALLEEQKADKREQSLVIPNVQN